MLGMILVTGDAIRLIPIALRSAWLWMRGIVGARAIGPACHQNSSAPLQLAGLALVTLPFGSKSLLLRTSKNHFCISPGLNFPALICLPSQKITRARYSSSHLKLLSVYI